MMPIGFGPSYGYQGAPAARQGAAPGGGYSLPRYGYQNQPAQQQAPSWYPQQAQSQQAPQWGSAMPWGQPVQQSSVEQQALGAHNAQQTQNFLRALQAVGAGSNNTFMSSGPTARPMATPILGAPMGYDGSAGTASYNGGFGAGGGNVNYYNMSPLTGQGTLDRGARLSGLDQGDISNYRNSQPNFGGITNYQPAASGPSPQSLAPWSGGPMTYGPMYQAGPSPQPAPQRLAMQANPYAMYAMSDERVKENVTDATGKLNEFLSAIGAHEYEYKDPRHGVGRFVSPMAQELEKTELGKSAVVETPEGKAVEHARLSGINLAANAMLHRRVTELEKQVLGGKKDG